MISPEGNGYQETLLHLYISDSSKVSHLWRLEMGESVGFLDAPETEH